MKVVKKYIYILLIFILTFTFVLKVNAQDVQVGNGISVAPVKVQRNFKIGDKETLKITLLNNESIDVDLSVNLKSFKLINNNQNISFDENIDDTILNWIRNFKNSVTLKPKEKFEYTLELNINTETDPGGYLFALLFETQEAASNNANQTTIKQSIGVPVIVNIAGVAGISYGDVSLDTFDITYNTFTNSVFYSAVILNNSNQIITPTGLISLKKVNGIGPEEIKDDFNSEGKILNSFSLRSFTKDIFLNQFALGEYEVNINFLYGIENNVFTQKTKLFIVPFWIPLLGFIIIVFIYRKYRHSNE